MALFLLIQATLLPQEASAENYLGIGGSIQSRVDPVAAVQFAVLPATTFEARFIGGGPERSQLEGQVKWALFPGAGLMGGMFNAQRGGGGSETGVFAGAWGEVGLGRTVLHGHVAFVLGKIDGEKTLSTLGARHYISDQVFVGAQVVRGLNRRDATVLALVGIGL